MTPFKTSKVISSNYFDVTLGNNGSATAATLQVEQNVEYTFFICMINATSVPDQATIKINGVTITETYVNASRSATLNTSTDTIRGYFVKFKATSSTITVVLSHAVNGDRLYTGFYALQ